MPEDGLADTIQPRFARAGADLTKVLDLSMVEADEGGRGRGERGLPAGTGQRATHPNLKTVLQSWEHDFSLGWNESAVVERDFSALHDSP